MYGCYDRSEGTTQRVVEWHGQCNSRVVHKGMQKDFVRYHTGVAMAPALDEERQMDTEEGHRDIEAWQGLTVRTREGHVVGKVVGVFAEGPLAGRLRVQGAYVLAAHKTGPLVGTAVFAIPRSAMLRRHQDSLELGTSLHAARARWLMHVTLKKGA
jgi:hypothetical protein